MSTCVVHLLILVAFISIGHKWCVLQFHPVGLFIVLFLALTWLAYVEGLHYGVVSLEKRDMSQYEQSFPRACKTHKVSTLHVILNFISRNLIASFPFCY